MRIKRPDIEHTLSKAMATEIRDIFYDAARFHDVKLIISEYLIRVSNQRIMQDNGRWFVLTRFPDDRKFFASYQEALSFALAMIDDNTAPA